MRALEREREALRRSAMRPLAVPAQDRAWESDVQIMGNEGDITRLPVESAQAITPDTFVFGVSGWFSDAKF